VHVTADHVRFEGFEVTVRGGDPSAGIVVDGSDVAIVANHVHDLRAPCGEDGRGSVGIVAGGGADGYANRDVRVQRNVVDHIGTGRLDGSCRLSHGIYAAVPRVTVADNIVYHSLGDGITSWHAATALTIVNNVSLLNGGHGILLGSGDSGATRAGNTRSTVANNIAYGNALAGIGESTDGSHAVGPGNRYLTNLTFGNGDGDSGSRRWVDGLGPGEVLAGNAIRDPGFVSRPPATVAGYRLRPGSPALDAGTCALAPTRDFDGVRRPQGAGVDIGAREQRSTAGRCRP
jgi:hypothetical protein